MNLRDKTVMLLGGGGLVGHAVAVRALAERPRTVVLVALFEDEVRRAATALEPHRGSAGIAIEWGNVFLPESVARLDRTAMLADAEHRALVIRDLFGDLTEDVIGRSLLCRLLLRHRPDVVVDSINTATAFAYQDIFQSARDLLARATDGSLDRAAVEQHALTLTMPQLIRHVQLMIEGLKRAGTGCYVKVGTSGTGGMGFNIPYTHSEERPSRTLMTKSAVAGAHSLLLFLMGRTPGGPATVEIKPTAAIAWREIGVGPVHRKGRPIPLVDCPAPLPVAEAFRAGAEPWRDLGEPLQGVYINTGENGLFSRDEFETVSTLGSMEFITPEEVADYVMLEIGGRPTGRDIVAALDGAQAGPTYRAGILRAHAVARLRELEERSGTRAVAYEMLGPPRLTKLLYEAHLLSLLRPSVRALAGSAAETLAAEAHRRLQGDHRLRQQILSVGLPIVTPDGGGVYRGRVVVVAPDPAEPLAAAGRGWVDLRPAQFAVWIRRAAEMVRAAAARAADTGSGSDADWTAIGADDPIEPARFATWVFRVEDLGERIKR